LADFGQQFAQPSALLRRHGARIRFQLVEHLEIEPARVANELRIGRTFCNRIGMRRIDRHLAARERDESVPVADSCPLPGRAMSYIVERMSPSKSWEGWTPPAELERPLPRPVRLTGNGIALCVAALLLATGGNEEAIWLAGHSRRQAADVRRILDDGRDIEGVVTRLWQTYGKGPQYHVAFHYFVNGLLYDARPADIGWQQWQNLQVGSPIPVRYLPSDPARNFPKGHPPYTVPLWFPLMLIPVFSVVSALLAIVVVRERRFLARGKSGARRDHPRYQIAARPVQLTSQSLLRVPACGGRHLPGQLQRRFRNALRRLGDVCPVRSGPSPPPRPIPGCPGKAGGCVTRASSPP
jgi:hypothetical protein